MTTRREGGLSEWMEPELDDKAITRQWLGVRDRMEAMRRRRWMGFFALTALSASAAVFALSMQPTAETRRARPVATTSPAATGSIEQVHLATRDARHEARIRDGSALALAPQTRIDGTASLRDVQLALDHGSVRFDVTHVPNRPFVVQAGPVNVRVVGTIFTVTRRDDAIRVDVERGRVEVRTPTESTFVGAGESWPTTAPQPVRERVQRPTASNASPEPQALEPETQEAVPTAEMLFAEANAARRAGRYDAAAQGYSALMTQFPRDARASLASYELGRMYLDAMHQPGRAIGPLRRAISTAPRSASYREDAMARLVAAYSRSNQTEACMQARDRYLAEYANGLHRTAVSRSCTVE